MPLTIGVLASARAISAIRGRRRWISAGLSKSLRGSRTRPLLLTWLLRASLIFVDEAAEDGPAPESLLGKVGDRVIGPGLAAAMGRRPL
jgi:hypothetical protein